MPTEDSGSGNPVANGGGERPRSRGVGGTKPIDSGNSHRDSDSGKPGTGAGIGRTGAGRVTASPTRTEEETVPLGKSPRREIVDDAFGSTVNVVERPKSVTGKPATGKGAEAQALIEMGIVGAFGSIAVATGHEHWVKSPEQVLPMSAPLVRMWNELPTKTRQNLEKKANPLLFLAGCFVVIGPDIAKEARLRREENAQRTVRRSNLQVVRGGVGGEGQQGTPDDNAVPTPPQDAFVNPIGS